MQELILGPDTKSIPPEFWGRPASALADERTPLSRLLTPLLVLDDGAERANVAALSGWAAERGLELAPHGKTTMAPSLWAHLLDAGAAMLTLATPWQAMVAREAGVRRILLANELLDPVGIDWVARTLDEDPEFELVCFLDSAEGLAALEASAGERPIDVLLEFGARGGRAGVRDRDDALVLAWGASRSPRVRLVGVAGWEGPFGPDREPESEEAVRRFLAGLAELALAIREQGFLEVERPIVSAGGSAWFDLVEEALAPLDGFRRILRSGAFQAHDSDHYAHLSPLASVLRPALRCRARVLSRPTPRLAILDAGRRDVPFDQGLPILLGDDGQPVPGARIAELNDQHAFLRLPPDHPLRVGEVVRLGISHPCTAFDRWRLVPVVDDADATDPVIVDVVRTFF